MESLKDELFEAALPRVSFRIWEYIKKTKDELFSWGKGKDNLTSFWRACCLMRLVIVSLELESCEVVNSVKHFWPYFTIPKKKLPNHNKQKLTWLTWNYLLESIYLLLNHLATIWFSIFLAFHVLCICLWNNY